MRRSIPIALALLALLAVPAGATVHVVDQSGLAFIPGDLTVTEGDTVRWMWSSGFHTVTSGASPSSSDAGQLFNAPLDSGHISFQYRFTTPATVPYFCNFHFASGMIGVITVNPMVPVKPATWSRIKILYGD